MELNLQNSLFYQCGSDSLHITVNQIEQESRPETVSYVTVSCNGFEVRNTYLHHADDEKVIVNGTLTVFDIADEVYNRHSNEELVHTDDVKEYYISRLTYAENIMQEIRQEVKKYLG